MPHIDLSFIIPAYNEAQSLPQLVREIQAESDKLNLSYEILIINDGSTDSTVSTVRKLEENDANIHLYSFQKNFGKANALSLGFEKSQGEVIFTMDGDLQDDPGEIKNFLIKLDQGWDMVSGWKARRQDPLEKTLPSKLFNTTVALFSGVKLHDFNCGFKAYRRHVVKELSLSGEMHRYIPVLANLKGFTVTEIVVNHRKRQYGQSKYGIGRYFKGFLDFVTLFFLMNYSKRPMHFFGLIGIFSFTVGFLSLFYLTFLKIFYNQNIGDRPLLNLSVLLIVIGVQFGFTGLIAEILMNPAFSSKNIYYKKD